MHEKVNTGTIIAYGSGNLGYGFVSQNISSYLMFFATAVLLLPGYQIGLIISLSIVWDAISDPIMGFISDHTKSKFGRRHIYIFWGAILTSVTNLLLWHANPDHSNVIKFFWVLIAVFLFKTFQTVYITPYSALGAEMSLDYHERSKIQAIKSMFFLGALISVTAISMFFFFRPTADYPIGQLNPLAYKKLAYTSTVIMLLTGMITCFTTQKYKKTSLDGQMNYRAFLEKVRFSLALKDFRQILFGYLSTNLASAIISVIGLHTFTYTFEMNNYEIAVVLGIQFIVCIAAQPLWVKIAQVVDKKRAMLYGLVISMMGCFMLAGMVVLRASVIEAYYLMIFYAVVIGFGTSPLFSLPSSMIADTVDIQEYETGDRNDGVYFGLMNFSYKISQSVAIFLMGFALDFIRFDPKLKVQRPFTLNALGIILSIGSLMAFMASMLFYRRYTLNEASVKEMQEAIQKGKTVTATGQK